MGKMYIEGVLKCCNLARVAACLLLFVYGMDYVWIFGADYSTLAILVNLNVLHCLNFVLLIFIFLVLYVTICTIYDFLIQNVFVFVSLNKHLWLNTTHG